MSTRFLSPGDASGGLMRKTGDPLADANRFISLCLRLSGKGSM